MEIRGERRCAECGERWSYYETGEVHCPACGSVRSVGVDDEHTLHTATADELDLSTARNAAADRPLRDAATEAAQAARSFVRGYGFVRAGELRPLDDTYLAAVELRYAAGLLAEGLDATDAEESYFLALLSGADEGERPPADAVPESLRAARGLAAASAVEAYRRDVTAWLRRRDADSDADADSEARAALERLGDHRKRVDALDGEIDSTDADRLVAAARAVGEALRTGEASAVATAREQLDALED